MRTSRVFVLGAIVGAAVVWRWGQDVKEYVEANTRRVRTKAAEGIRTVEEKSAEVLDRGSNVLHRVEEAIRPAS